VAANLKRIRRRIAGVRSTEKITAAMEMVAASKLRRAQAELFRHRAFAEDMGRLVERIAWVGSLGAHPLLRVPTRSRALVVLVTSNRGLCGGFNANALQRLEELHEERLAACEHTTLLFVGRKGKELLHRTRLSFDAQDDAPLPAWPGPGNVPPLADRLRKAFVSDEIDSCWVVFNRFVSTLRQEADVCQLLPLRWVGPHKAEAPVVRDWESSVPPQEHIYEPTRAAVLDELLPASIRCRLLWTLLESRAAEHGARMTAMQAATRSAEDMIGSLTLEYNRARQTTITGELLEIVAGAEALR